MSSVITDEPEFCPILQQQKCHSKHVIVRVLRTSARSLYFSDEKYSIKYGIFSECAFIAFVKKKISKNEYNNNNLNR